MTLNSQFQESVKKYGEQIALKYKVKKEWHDISFRELAKRVETFAAGLQAIGVERGDRMALLAENRPEWPITDLATLALGGIVVPLYPTLPVPQIAFIVRNSGAKCLVVSDKKQLDKALQAKKDAPELQLIVVMDGETSEADNVLSFADVTARGEANPFSGNAFEERWKSVKPDDIASLVYTSGTTGDPKGAMLSHNNIAWNVDSAIEHFRRQGEKLEPGDIFLSFLPLSHAFERTTGYYLPLRIGGAIAYSEGVRTIVDDMAANKPTIMVCVPRVYEAMQERILAQVEKADKKRQELFYKALHIGQQYAEQKRRGGLVNPWIALQRMVLDRLVFAKVRERFGGRVRFFVSGGAALNLDTARFFEAIGIPILEGYGMTEASPVMAVNPNRRVKLGTVGVCMPGGELKIASDGEIIYRGPNVMRGYWNNEQATRDMIDGDGWLHSGDIGELDSEGYLKITDRKKDLLVLHNGKKVAPQPIESLIKQSAFINEVVLIGDRQNIVTALIVPNKSRLTDWAKAEGLNADDEATLLQTAEVRKKLRQEIDAQSKGLADFEKVKKFTVLDATFSVDSGELTPTLKVKRKVVAQKYAREIALMAGDE